MYMMRSLRKKERERENFKCCYFRYDFAFWILFYIYACAHHTMHTHAQYKCKFDCL